MTAIRQAAPATPRAADAGGRLIEMLPDPPKNGDDMNQEPILSSAAETLRAYFFDRRDVLVRGAGYLCVDTREREGQIVPDCLVAFGVNTANIFARNGYVIREVGKPPDFALEVASESTGRADYTTKRRRYAELNVPEYWRFDETGGKFHDKPIAGDRLVDGAYLPIEIVREPDGMLWGRSAVLGLDLCWDAGRLRFYDPVAGEYLRSQLEEKLGRLAEREQRQAERERSLAAEARHRAEFERRLAAEAQRQSEIERRLAAEAEILRLRERLRRGGGYDRNGRAPRS